MQQGQKFFTIISVLCLALVVQLALIFADCKDTPTRTAVGFATAYFNLDPSMADYLCKEFVEQEDADLVQAYINQVGDEARQSGFELSYMRMRLFGVQTEILSESESEAEVRITAKARRNINPVFTIIAKFFAIGESHPIDETLNLIKEDGRWKVCGKAFSLAV
ncbi:MAG: hypothetical protein AMJ54_00785 [Deltaproteobacteria bacterium SG8_13]|nr:MAG: hypothetical protein AMJ54_00785 [Deltaproteobacteria bacterium SG8_13]